MNGILKGIFQFTKLNFEILIEIYKKYLFDALKSKYMFILFLTVRIIYI